MYDFLRKTAGILAILIFASVAASATSLDSASFTITVPAGQGDLSGTYSGSVTWDPAAPFYSDYISFNTTFPIWQTGTLPQIINDADSGYPYVLSYENPDISVPGEDNAFVFSDIALSATAQGTGSFSFGVKSGENYLASEYGTITFTAVGDPPFPPAATPEPESLVLLTTGLAGFVTVRWRNQASRR